MADEEAEEVEVKGPKQDEDQKRGLNKVTAMGDQEKEVDTSKVAQTVRSVSVFGSIVNKFFHARV